MKNKTFLSGGSDTTVKFWDIRNYQCECYAFKEHSSPITKLANIELGDKGDKFMFMSGSRNGEVFLWEQEVEFIHGAHTSPIV